MRLCAAIKIDFIPEAQTLLTVVQGVRIGRPESKKLYKIVLFKGQTQTLGVSAIFSIGQIFT